MAEKALYNALSDYNRKITNNYTDNWGSLLDFMGKFASHLRRFADNDDTE